MAQDDVDRLQVAWLRLQKAVNTTIPNNADKLRSIRQRMVPPGTPPPGGKPS